MGFQYPVRCLLLHFNETLSILNCWRIKLWKSHGISCVENCSLKVLSEHQLSICCWLCHPTKLRKQNIISLSKFLVSSKKRTSIKPTKPPVTENSHSVLTSSCLLKMDSDISWGQEQSREQYFFFLKIEGFTVGKKR